MCWNLKVSLYAALYGFAMCYYFYKRNYSPRDPWYALFLCSFTCTQLLDAFFWSRSTDHQTNLECDGTNVMFTKWVVTPVLFFQIITITWFPSTQNAWLRAPARLVVALIILGVGCIAQCTYIYQTTGGLFPGPTLIYWGFIPTSTLFTIGVALWSVAALLFIYPTVYATNILLVGGINLVLLHFIDGTIYLVSKLCFYCLLLSVLWYFEPFWAPAGNNEVAKAPTQDEEEDETVSAICSVDDGKEKSVSVEVE